MKKTALILSGGGSRGAYEIGVWKALKKLHVRIDMVMGTSVGAINSAMIAQKNIQLAQKLWRELETDMIFDVESSGIPAEDVLTYAKEIVLRGGAGTSGLSGLLNQFINEKKLRRSRMDYGLVTAEFPTLNERYLYKKDIPQGRLADYIMASASCFPAVQKCIIDGQQFVDGGYRDNLPVKMALERNASRIIAVDLQAVGVIKHDIIRHAKETCDEFHLIRSSFDLGNFLIFDKANTSKIMRLGFLDTMRHFDKYDGMRYTFKKNALNSHELQGADNAAYFFHLDPCKIYSKRHLISAIKEKTAKADEATSQISELKPLKLTDAKKVIEIIKDVTDDTDLHMQLVLHIAENLKQEKENSIFLYPAIFKILTEEIQAANFLINNNITKRHSD